MAHPSIRRRGSFARAGLLALGALALALAPSRAQEPLRENLVTPGSTQPITIAADDIATWTEGTQRIFLLRGKVTVSQGRLVVRMAEGVLWVDEERQARTRTYFLDLYTDRKLSVENGDRLRSGPGGLLQLATRGQIDLKAFGRPVAQKALAGDPLYQRAQSRRPALVAGLTPAATGAQPVPVQAPPSPVPLPVAQSTSAKAPTPALLPAAVANDAPKLGPITPIASQPTTGIQQVQAQVPVQTPPTVPVPGADQPPPVTLGQPAVTPPVPAAQGPPRQLTIRPRSGRDSDTQFRNFPLANGETAYVYTGGVILTVTSPGQKGGLLDIEGDRLTVWSKGNPQELFGLRGQQGTTSKSLEFYISGNVELRFQGPKETEILRADEVYYDVGRNVALATKADLEVKEPKLIYPIHVKAPEMWQLNAQTFQTGRAEVYSTILPSDPGLKIQLSSVTLEEREAVRRTIFGLPYRDRETGEPKAEKERYFKGSNMVVTLEGVPLFYFPYLAGRVEDPLGPLDGLSFNYNRSFGFQIYSTWDVFDLIGVDRPAGQRWRLYLDYLSQRGPALGTEYDYASNEFFGAPARVDGMVKAWGLRDQGHDILGASRGDIQFIDPTTYFPVTHPDYRGRFLGKLNVQDLPNGFSFQTQASLLSDMNFLEQFYQQEFANDLNQETFAYLKQQQNNWAWTVLAETRVRDWVTETEWLPKADGYLLGQKVFDYFTYNAHAGAGYAQFMPTGQAPFAYLPTDVRTNTARLDLWQDVSLPFTLGAFKVVPYAVADLTYYSEDVNGDQVGRAYGGGGVRASVPFSRLYPEIQSDLFNVNGIFHKITLSGNYFAAQSSTSFQNLPQLDRLNDDVSDFALRQMQIWQFLLNPNDAKFLTTSPLFNPQIYAIRRLVDNRTDTLDSIDVLQLDLRQRWQTKRGMPGNEHVVDWMTLDLRASVFPHSQRDNFGNTLGILEYDWVWNIGDRTALVSSGWLEPIDNGPRFFTFGTFLSRPDNTNFYLGYRQIDPLDSRAVIASLSYAFSPKYAITASTTWDFGIHNQAYTVMLSRIGTDVQLNLGITYNSILGNFGVAFEIVPNLLRGSIRPGPGVPLLNNTNTIATGNGR